MTDNDDDNDFEFPSDFHQGALGDIGKMGLTVFRAVLRDGGTDNEAFSITAAFFAGAMKATRSDDDQDD